MLPTLALAFASYCPLAHSTVSGPPGPRLLVDVYSISGQNSATLLPFTPEGPYPFPNQPLYTSARVQQVIHASEFASVGTPGWIVGFCLRVDGQTGYNFRTGLNISIDLSTTARGPDGLSAVFADNIGSDATRVIPLGGTPLGGDPGPDANVAVPFTTSFYYDPSRGNLLIDIRNFTFIPADFPQQFHAAPLDARDVMGDTISRVWAGNANALSGTADSLGLTMLISFVPVPEPSAWALLLSGAAICGAWHWRRKRATQTH